MKTKNVWMPMLAFLVAIGMAFATTPINQFEADVWTGTGPLDCHAVDCMQIGTNPCEETDNLYGNPTCTQPIDEAFKPN